ncbi:MAG: HD domain-containing protein [Chitinispirillaceae bacterium]|nr:HD domain-containing protein [Chitinispirillaceae bacterium]
MNASGNRRLSRQLRFLCEIDRAKSVYRRTLLMDGSRRENDAEHAWHFAIMAIVLSELSKRKGIDVLKVVTMALIHDIVEIDCGDTFLYDEKLRQRRKKQEARAATRIFGLLPPDQARIYVRLWKEFEAGATAEAKFAAALDRFQPILHNYKTGGRVWKEANVTPEQVLRNNRHMAKGAPLLWELAQRLVREATEKRWLSDRASGMRKGKGSPPRKS